MTTLHAIRRFLDGMFWATGLGAFLGFAFYMQNGH